MPSPETLDQVLREGRNRLYPSLRNPNWLILRRRRQIFEEGLSRLPERSLSVLDIGGRLQPYRPLLGSRVKRYVAVDLRVTPLVNAVAAGEALPFCDKEFDFVICTQVFEYLPDPYVVASEIQRVLRKGGCAFLSAPAVFLRDSDREYWRFLPEGLRYVFRDFETVEVIPEGNSLIGFFRTLNIFLVSFTKPRFLIPLLEWTLVPGFNLAANALERLAGKNDQFSVNFSVWVRK
jgi:SAM-dependent methyltransferase